MMALQTSAGIVSVELMKICACSLQCFIKVQMATHFSEYTAQSIY